jgi:predicted MFS family arabinose efflux permease
MRRPAALAALRHPTFRLLICGQLASNVGDALYAVALPWYVLANHGGALLLAVVLAAYGIPRTALVAVGGHASDRWRPWTVMMLADAVRIAGAAALGVSALSGPAHAAVLIPIALVLGAGEGMFLPASYAIIPSLLPDAELQAGNALAMGGAQLAVLIGPALGGALVATSGPASAFLLDAVTFAGSVLTLVRIRAARMPGLATAPADADAGAVGPTLRRFVRTQPVLWIILLVTVAANLGSGAIDGVALPALAHGPLHAGAAGYGGLLAAFGGGALLGTLIAGSRQVGRPAVVASVAFLGSAAMMAIVPSFGGALAAGAALAVCGVLNGAGNVLTVTAFQRWAPPALIGRLMGLLLLASFGIYPVSVLLGGIVVHSFGAGTMFPLAAALLAAAVLAGLTQASWRAFGATTAPATTAPATTAPATTAPDYSGPAASSSISRASARISSGT